MRYLGILGWIGGWVAAQNTYVGIGTAAPTHRLHLATGTLQVQALSGTGTVLAQTDAIGVLGRFAAATAPDQLLQGNAVWGSDATDWQLLGNAGTNPTVHFVGTTDARDFRLGVNGLTRWRILSTGEHWVGGSTTATLNNAQVSVDAPPGWIAVYAQVTGGGRPALRGTVGDNSSGPAVGAVNTASDGWGAIGIGSGSSIGNLPSDGGGAYGVSTEAGVVGSYTGNDGSSRAGGAFAVRDGGGAYDWVYVAGYEGGTQRKIWGVGTASTTIQTEGKYHTLFCLEAPEVLLWDAGRFALQAQRQRVPFDSLLVLYLAPPYMVWLQPWGDVALRVVEVTPQGFWVEADRPVTQPLEVSFLVQARRLGPSTSPFHHERLPAVQPSRFFTPFRPVTQYLTPDQLK